jgi:hypothetical protein
MTLTETMTKDKLRKGWCFCLQFLESFFARQQENSPIDGSNFAGSDPEQDSKGCTDHNMSPDIRK